jgi:hypothetical protein
MVEGMNHASIQHTYSHHLLDRIRSSLSTVTD